VELGATNTARLTMTALSSPRWDACPLMIALIAKVKFLP